MLKLVYSLLTLPYSQSVELRPNDNINLMTFEDLQLEGPEGNKREVQTILRKLNKVDMVSNIADFDTKAIKFDDVISATKKLLEKKDTEKTQELWENIIELASHGDETVPRNQFEALHYVDRREFFHTLTENLGQIKDLRSAIKVAKQDGNDTVNWQQDQVKLNQLILATDLNIEQIDDSLLDRQRYIEMIAQNVQNKDLFRAAMDFQEIVRQRYMTFFLEFYSDFDLNQKRVSDGAFKMAHDFHEDINVYSKLAQGVPKSSDKKCAPFPIWPTVVLAYCDDTAERLGFGDDELEFCKCYNLETKALTRRKPKTQGKGNGIENYVTIDFKSGVPPKDEIPDAPKRAMMDLGASYRQSSKYDGNWNKPRLDSLTGFWPAQNKIFEPMWLEVTMPGAELYEVSAMSIMKMANPDYKHAFVKAVKFQFSYDEGKNWHTHNDGKWYETGAIATEGPKVQHQFDIEPVMHGNAFRVLLDKEHFATAPAGRFDLWAVKTPDFRPEDLKPEPKKAIMELNAIVTANHIWDKEWSNGRLDSPTGLWNGKGQDYTNQWFAVNLNGEDFYETSSLIMKPRGDVKDPERAINAVQFEYSNDNGKTWFSHNNGKWYNTSASVSDGVNTERTVTIDPPMTGNAFKILVDHHNNHITGRSTVARFDFLVDISPDYKPVEGIKEMPKRAMMDLKAKFSASSVWDSAWNNPRLDSKTAIWSAKDQNLDDQWWQVTMPGQGFYDVSALTLMKRGDELQNWRYINDVQFQFSQDGGKTFHDFEGGKWFKTGQLPNDPFSLERVIEFETPMTGNAFRIVLTHADNHVVGKGTHGRFDFWVLPNPEFKPEELKEAPKMAMMDLGATFTASSYYNGQWKNPRLDSKTGVHTAPGQAAVEQWWQVTMPGEDFYECSAMTLMKRGDGYNQGQNNAVQFQFSQDNGQTWHDHEDGKWFKTGSLNTDDMNVARKFDIEPPMHGNAFRVILDAAHTVGVGISGRFDLWVVKDEDYKPLKDLDVAPQRAMMDLGATYSQSSKWDNNWNKPRLDSRSGFHNKAGQGQNPMWLQVSMPNNENYEVSEMSLMRRADGCCGNQHRQIDAVSFETSDDGVNFYPHNDGHWYKTGQIWNDNVELERRITITPPMNGKFFRVIIDKDHKQGPEIQGRFELWAVKNTAFKPEKRKPNPQRAMMDLSATFTASSYWDNNWKNPKLNSPYGVHNAPGQGAVEQWWQVDLPGEGFYEASAMSLMKRGDGYDPQRTINAVQFQFSQDNGQTWHDHEDGKWFPTGALTTDTKDIVRKFKIDPPMNGNAFRVVLDAAHVTGSQIQGRFDLWVVKNDDYKVKKDLEVEPQRAMIDLGATFTSSSKWDNNWIKPRLDSRSGFHNKAGLGDQPFWLQLAMPNSENYEVSEMSLMRRADGCCGNQHRQIDAVSFETSDDGVNFYPHNDGQWYKTGQQWNDNVELERRIKIEPPMNGKFFRVIIDKEHKTGPEIQGRFELWAVKNADYVPEKRAALPKRAMMDLGATYTQSSKWDNNWIKPRLDSRSGFHNQNGQGENPMWLQVNMPGDKNFEVSSMSLKRRGDGCCGNQQRQINAVSFETSQDGSTWNPHNGGEWYKTGQVWNDNVELERRIEIDPPMIGKFFRVVIDKDHKSGPNIQGRFDLWAVETDKEPIEEESEQVGGLSIGKCYQFSSKNFPGNAFRHRNGEVWLDKKDNGNALYKADSTWKVIKGNLGGEDTISLQSVNYPQNHLKHENWLAYSKSGQGQQYNKDSTFKIISDGEFVQFESVNIPGHMMRHANFRLRLSKDDGSDLFNLDSRFSPKRTSCSESESVVQVQSLISNAAEQKLPTTVSEQDLATDKSPIQIGQCYRFESQDSSNFMLFSRKDSAMYAQSNSSLIDSTFKAVAGQDDSVKGGVSFESTSVPGRFLRHWASNKVSLHGTDTLNIEKDSTFIIQPSLASTKGIQLEASNSPRSFVVKEDGKVKLQKFQLNDGFEQKATWTPVKVDCTTY